MTAGATTTTSLVARTVELDPARPVDLVAVAGTDGFLFEQEGHGLAARGAALRIPLRGGLAGGGPEVAEALGAISTDDDVGIPGTGAIAVGALPFAAAAPASMVVPALVVGRSADGRQWMTTIGAEGPRVAGPPELPAVEERPSLPDAFSLRTSRSHGDWEETIARAVDAVSAGHLDKVVVARDVIVEANRPIVIPDVLERLRALYPSCAVFSAEGFIGASPELLVQRTGRSVRSHPLAGTYPRSGDPHADDVLAASLMASAKERREHRFVIEAIAGVLGPLCTSLDVPDGPAILPLRNVLHLGTEIAGVLAAEPPPSALELAALLHPTPAVGGTPAGAALEWLARHEHLDRSRYAGPVGWVDARGDGIFAVGIRSAEIEGPRARLFAGVGVVEGSEPRRELVETQLKLQAILAAVVRP